MSSVASFFLHTNTHTITEKKEQTLELHSTNNHSRNGNRRKSDGWKQITTNKFALHKHLIAFLFILYHQHRSFTFTQTVDDGGNKIPHKKWVFLLLFNFSHCCARMVLLFGVLEQIINKIQWKGWINFNCAQEDHEK